MSFNVTTTSCALLITMSFSYRQSSIFRSVLYVSVAIIFIQGYFILLRKHENVHILENSNNISTLQNIGTETEGETEFTTLTLFDKFVFESNSYFEKKQRILTSLRKSVEQENSSLCNCKNYSNRENDEDDDHGKKIQTLIVSNWRFGSSFLGELIASHPSTYYLFEPLVHFPRTAIEGEQVSEALRTLEQLFMCNYTNLESHIERALRPDFLRRNRILNAKCHEQEICKNSEFLQEACEMFPYQAIKCVRLRLKYTESLVTNPQLNVRVVLLVRDPRAAIISRRKHLWCTTNPDCGHSRNLCGQLLDDYVAALYLKKKYPDRYLILRFEDISTNLNKTLTLLQNFLHLEHHPRMEKFLKSHTSQTANKNDFSTVRKSEAVIFKWKEHFEKNEGILNDVQLDCKEALEFWGYNIFQLGIHSWQNFDPVLESKFPVDNITLTNVMLTS